MVVVRQGTERAHAEAVEESLKRQRAAQQLPSGQGEAAIEDVQQRQIKEWDAAFQRRQQQRQQQPEDR